MKMFKPNEALNGTATKEDSKNDGRNCETTKCESLTCKEKMGKQVMTTLHDNGCRENISSEIKKQEEKSDNINGHSNEYENNKEKDCTGKYVENLDDVNIMEGMKDMGNIEEMEDGEDDEKRTIHMFQFSKSKVNVNNILEQQKNTENEEREREKQKNFKYDDGNPEIKYFTNKNNLKIATYAWKVENPKAYIFGIHGITSHLRNEYMCYKGRPSWVDEMKKNENGKNEENDKNKGSNKNEENEKNDKNEENEETILIEREENQNIVENDIKVTLNKYMKQNEHTKKNFTDSTTPPFSNDSTSTHKKHEYLETEKSHMFSDSFSFGRDHVTHFQNKQKDEENKNEDMNFNKDNKIHFMDDADSHKWDDLLDKDTNKNIWETNKDESHETLRPFVSCSSCIGDESTSSDIFEKIKGHRLSESVYREISSHKLIEDENILTVEENEIKQNIHPADVYFCSNCGMTKGCDCGQRILSYKNSWIEYFNESHFSFFGIDNQAHGLSEGWENQRCNVQNFENFVTDAVDALEIFVNDWKQEKKMKPIIILGLSMGGCIALKAVERIFRLNKPWKEYVKGLILVSPMISLEKQKRKLINKILIPVSKLLNYFYPHFTLSVKENNVMYPWIIKDSKNDPLQYFGPLKIKIAVECISAADNCLSDMTMEQIDQSDIDVLILQSKYDTIVDPKGAIDFMNKLLNVRERKKKGGGTETKNEEAKKEEAENEKAYGRGRSKSLDVITTHSKKGISSTEQCNSKRHVEKPEVETQNSFINGIRKNATEEKHEDILGNEKTPQSQERHDNEKEEKKEIEAIKVPKSSRRYSDFVDFINTDERYSLLDSDIFAQTKHKVWNIFEYGYYKKFDFLKHGKQENTNNNDLQKEDKYKTLTVYIFKCGCHTLSSEPLSREIGQLVVDWANSRFP